MSPRPMERALAALALVLGGLAAISGAPAPLGRSPRISPLDLAVAIRGAQGGAASPWVLDLRSKAEWAERRVPSALHADGPVEGPADRGRAIVLYGDASSSIEATAASLRAAGYRRVYVLDGGLDGWIEQVMRPEVSPADHELAKLSRYFGGLPRARGASATPAVFSHPRGGGC